MTGSGRRQVPKNAKNRQGLPLNRARRIRPLPGCRTLRVCLREGWVSRNGNFIQPQLFKRHRPFCAYIPV